LGGIVKWSKIAIFTHTIPRRPPPIHIIVKGGAVTLEGAVDSESDRNMAYLRASKAAHHLTNNLRVAPEELLGAR